ncbi:MAG: pimeloyl-ACP methyl ester carboxylesterase [Ilumatobacter sp.]|jgi:pimeloyl-ACP methyl ester carboxylesterase
MKKLAIGVMGRLAEHLSNAGVASFRYDKRGVGASGGDYFAAGFSDNIADDAATIDMLRARPEVDPEQIYVIGHSEGALIATELAASDPGLGGVVLLAGTATVGEEVLRWQAQQIAATLPKPVRFILRVLRKDVASMQAKRLSQIKATTGDTTRIQLAKLNAKWFREFLAHDPSPSLEAIRVPVLAVTGSNDLQVDSDDIERICELVPLECSGHVVDGVTHLLRNEFGPPSFKTYKKQAQRPLDPRVLDLVTSWIAATTNSQSESSDI